LFSIAVFTICLPSFLVKKSTGAVGLRSISN